VRLVRFTDDDGAGTIYGTYTAYNGVSGFPSLFISNDLKTIASHTMAGSQKNKGMAPFPRRINGNYVMSGRLDGGTGTSWNPTTCSSGTGDVRPRPRSIGGARSSATAGRPSKPGGMVMLTHGVGPSAYAIGATLLDLDNPAKVIGRSAEPIIVPAEDERVGYVPNVVYTCGAMQHNHSLIIPYAMGDVTTTFACLQVDELTASLNRE
jgi:predicted GH43/DUF377 family glycosyl hydrolase